MGVDSKIPMFLEILEKNRTKNIFFSKLVVYSSDRKLRAKPKNRKKTGFENVSSSLKSALIRTG